MNVDIRRLERTIEDWDWTGTVYICGPMSNLASTNIDSFHLVDRVLRKHKDKPKVLNPATLDQGSEYCKLVRQSFSMLVQADKMIVLPKWECSTGASSEIIAATLMNLTIRFVHPAYLTSLMVFEADRSYRMNPL